MSNKHSKSDFFNLKCILRGIKIVFKIMPKYIPCMLVYVLFSTIPIYTNIFFSAKILDEIIGACRLNILIMYVVFMSCINFFSILISKLGWRYVRVNQMISGDWEDIYLNDKNFNMDFEQVEDFRIRELRQRIEDNRNIGGLNVLIIKLMFLFQNILNLLLSSIMMVKIMFLFSKQTHSGLLAFANSPWSVIFLIVLTILLSIILAKNAQKGYFEKSQKAKELSIVQKKSHFYINDYLEDSKTGKDVRIFEQHNIIIDTAKEMLDRFFVLNKDFITIQFEVDKKLAFFSLFLNACVYIVVTLKTLAGAFSLGVMIKYISLINQFLHNILYLSDSLVKLKENNLYLKLLYEYLDYDTKMKSGAKLIKPITENEKYVIEFHNVSFKYPQSENYSIRNVSFKIHNGEHIAIVGMNGCGKSTLIKLLCRLYDPCEGKITLNGEDIRNYNYSSYLDAFSVVFQDFRLFPITIGQNIASSIIYDETKVMNCINSVGITQIINGLPDGLDTNIYKSLDENGVEVSGGEAQKIAIARALYKDGPFVILDEPTASLDPLAESEIYANFNKITENKTSFLISHRLSSCKFCDKILVLDNGEITQEGNHNSLLSNEHGLYYRLWNSQAQYYKR